MRSAYSRKVEKVHKVNTSNPNLKCCWCNRRHKGNDCPFKSKECYICRKEGHITKVCRSIRNNRGINLVEEEEKENLDEDSTDEIFNGYKLSPGTSKSRLELM